MNKVKYGFSLAELLIAVAIIAVLAVMGLTISKKGMDNAANMYFYTAYTSLNDVIYNAFKDGKNFDGSYDLNSSQNKAFLAIISSDFGVEDGNANYKDGDFIFTTKNGVTFKFLNVGNFQDKEYFKYTPIKDEGDKSNSGKEGKEGEEETEPEYYIYPIEIQIPRKKNNTTVCTYFSHIKEGKILLVPSFDEYLANRPNYVNLSLRKDLLPIYLSNGKRGKVKVYADSGSSSSSGSSSEIFEPYKYFTYRDAYCKVNQGQSLFVGKDDKVTEILTCPTNSGDSNEKNSIIKYANPRKVF